MSVELERIAHVGLELHGRDWQWPLGPLRDDDVSMIRSGACEAEALDHGLGLGPVNELEIDGHAFVEPEHGHRVIELEERQCATGQGEDFQHFDLPLSHERIMTLSWVRRQGGRED